MVAYGNCTDPNCTGCFYDSQKVYNVPPCTIVNALFREETRNNQFFAKRPYGQHFLHGLREGFGDKRATKLHEPFRACKAVHIPSIGLANDETCPECQKAPDVEQKRRDDADLVVHLIRKYNMVMEYQQLSGPNTGSEVISSIKAMRFKPRQDKPLHPDVIARARKNKEGVERWRQGWNKKAPARNQINVSTFDYHKGCPHEIFALLEISMQKVPLSEKERQAFYDIYSAVFLLFRDIIDDRYETNLRVAAARAFRRERREARAAPFQQFYNMSASMGLETATELDTLSESRTREERQPVNAQISQTTRQERSKARKKADRELIRSTWWLQPV